jgi:hypothetical protein
MLKGDRMVLWSGKASLIGWPWLGYIVNRAELLR